MTQHPEDDQEYRTEDLEDDDMFARRERDADGRGRQRPLGEFVRRAIENTVGSVEKTGSIPREALQYILQQGDRGKREAVRLIANEVGDFLRHVDISGEVIKVLTSVQMDLSASVKFKHQDGRLSTEVKIGDEETPVETDPPADDPKPTESEAPTPASSDTSEDEGE